MTKRRHYRKLRIAFAALFMAAVFGGFGGAEAAGFRLAGLLRYEFVPAVLRSWTAAGLGALGALAAILLLTFIGGRFYCAVLCPLGILQDVCGWLSRRPARPGANRPLLRYVIAAAVLGLLAGGSAAGFTALDPYSNFGGIAALLAGLSARPLPAEKILFYLAGALLPLGIITGLALWKKRFFCTAICPAGTLLGLAARQGVFRLTLTEKCVACGQCVKKCPAGCIDLTGKYLDNERCVRCLNCLAVCPAGGVEFGRGKAAAPAQSLPPAAAENAAAGAAVSRREFIRCSAAAAAAFAGGLVLARCVLPGKSSSAAGLILPPGAGSYSSFAARCTSCQLCAANCPAGIIRPAPGRYGVVRLDLERGSCRFDCNACGEVCPTGAITPLPLAQKQRIKIASVKLRPQYCGAFQTGEKCGKCAAACPVAAITLRANGTPRPVDAALCIGCGACREVCPSPRALPIAALPETNDNI